MDYLKDLHELCETLSQEVGEANEKIRAAGGKLSAGDLEYIDELTHSLKSIKTTMAMMESEGEGYSYEGSYRGMSRNSYARGMSPITGRYVSRDGGYSNRRPDYSGRYSRDGEKEQYLAKLEEVLESAPDDATRNKVMKIMSDVSNKWNKEKSPPRNGRFLCR